MKYQKLWTTVFLVIMLISMTIPGLTSSPVQAATGGWVENPSNAVLNLAGNDSGTPTIIWDSTDHLYKAWFVKTTLDTTTIDGFIDGVGPNFSAVLVSDLLSGSFSHIASADTVSVKAVINYLAGLTNAQLTALFGSVYTTVMYSESGDGTTWSVPTATNMIGGSATDWDTFISTPDVIKDGTTYKMWYTGSRIGTIGTGTLQLFSDLNLLTAPQMGTVLNDLVNEDLSALKTHLSSTSLSLTTLMTDMFNILTASQPEIGYATSLTNGKTDWTKSLSNPVMLTGTGAWDNFGVMTPSVIKNSPGSYEMWYTGININLGGMLSILSDTNFATFEADLMNNIQIGIGHTTSTDGITGWGANKSAGAVLTKGGASDWDANAVFAPSVIRNSTGNLEMWYTGAKIDPGTIFSYLKKTMTLNNALLTGFNPAIGHATYDGSAWNKDTAGNPVISRGTGAAWDNYGVAYPSVVQNGDTRMMLYTGWTTDLFGALSGLLNGDSITTALAGTHVAIGEAKWTEITPVTYTISASAGTGGSISPSGSVTVIATGGVTFTISPGTGYTIAGVTIDGGSIGPVASYQFTNVTANHSIGATFSLIPVSTTTTTTSTTSTTTTTTETSTTTTTTTSIPPPVTTTVTGTGTVDPDKEVLVQGLDKDAMVLITAGTIVTDANGNVLPPGTEISLTQITTPPGEPPAGDNIVAEMYDFEPSGAHFNPPLSMTFTYDDNTVNPVIAYWSVSEGQWIMVSGGVVDPVNHTITVQVDHFTTFTVMGQPAGTTTTTTGIPTSTTTTPVQKPAAFTVSGLNISPSQVKPGEQVNISVNIQNTGDIEGTYTVTLMINKLIEGTQAVTLTGGAETKVNFTASGDVTGNYLVEIGGLSGSFTVTTHPIPSWLWPTVIGVIAALVILAVGILLWRRRAAKPGK